MIPTIRSSLRSEGKVAVRENGLEWSSDLDIVRVVVAVSDHHTELELRGDARLDLIAAYVAALVFLVLPGAGLGIAAAMGWRVFMLALVPAAWVVGRIAWQVVGSRFRGKLQNLAKRLVAQSDRGVHTT